MGAEMDDELTSYQPTSADVHMTSPRQVSEPARAPRCRSVTNSATELSRHGAASPTALQSSLVSTFLPITWPCPRPLGRCGDMSAFPFLPTVFVCLQGHVFDD